MLQTTTNRPIIVSDGGGGPEYSPGNSRRGSPGGSRPSSPGNNKKSTNVFIASSARRFSASMANNPIVNAAPLFSSSKHSRTATANSKTKRHHHATTNSSTNSKGKQHHHANRIIYKAPQASIRRNSSYTKITQFDDESASSAKTSSKPSGNTRRRRGREKATSETTTMSISNSHTNGVGAVNTNDHGSNSMNNNTSEHHHHIPQIDDNIKSMRALPEPPLIWDDGVDSPPRASPCTVASIPKGSNSGTTAVGSNGGAGGGPGPGPKRKGSGEFHRSWQPRTPPYQRPQPLILQSGEYRDEYSDHPNYDEEFAAGGFHPTQSYPDGLGGFNDFDDRPYRSSARRGGGGSGGSGSGKGGGGRSSRYCAARCTGSGGSNRGWVNKLFGGYGALLQLLIIMGLGGIIFDAHHKVSRHKNQLQQYDEERAHILEQMMWIDKAAKKVHKKYSQQDLLAPQLVDPLNVDPLKVSSPEELVKNELRQRVVELKNQMEKLQVRVQLNDRERIQERFGIKPVQVSLGLDPAGEHQLIIALSEDTPHAVSTFLQQIDKGLWEEIQFQLLESSGSIQISSKKSSSTSPLLEFVEKSRGCREFGSVALRQFQTEGLHVLVLRVHTYEDRIAKPEEDEVCIGKVISGLDELQKLPLIPIDTTGDGGDGDGDGDGDVGGSALLGPPSAEEEE